MKHAIALQIVPQLARTTPVTVLDTHAGAGVYDLWREAPRRSGEAGAGLQRLMETPSPAVFAPLTAAVRDLNRPGEVRWCPGSPALIAGVLRPADRYVGCELRADDHGTLVQTLDTIAKARRLPPGAVLALNLDGYKEAAAFARGGARGLVLIDPPYERGDDYEQVVGAARRLHGREDICTAIWTPLKDLETFDALLRRLEALDARDVLIAQVRLRPLRDPMRMNGCAMVLINAPDVAVQVREICGWVATALGEDGNSAQVFRL